MQFPHQHQPSELWTDSTSTRNTVQIQIQILLPLQIISTSSDSIPIKGRGWGWISSKSIQYTDRSGSLWRLNSSHHRTFIEGKTVSNSFSVFSQRSWPCLNKSLLDSNMSVCSGVKAKQSLCSTYKYICFKFSVSFSDHVEYICM